MADANRYARLLESIFFLYYQPDLAEIPFRREEIEQAAGTLGIKLPKNLGDVLYSFRYRAAMPVSITSRAPEGKVWIIRPAGRALYKFVLVNAVPVTPNGLLSETKIPDATPGIVAMYALNDEQALLTKVRYNRLIDIFCGVTCYSLQNHLRTTVPNIGQVETDEIYVGVDKRGAHYVFPVQAKGGSDHLSIVQIEQDFALCQHKFPNLVCRAIGAQFMDANLIALFEFELGGEGVAISSERHYRLAPPDQISSEDLRLYQQRLSE